MRSERGHARNRTARHCATRRRSRSCALWAIVASAACAAPAAADVALPHVLSNNMVLQRGMPVRIWGLADVREAVTVKLAEREVGTRADEHGRWAVELPAMQAGGPHEMTVSAGNTIRRSNILVGEVWMCSGQSNMAWPVGSADNGDRETAAANYPQIRLFTAPKKPAGRPAFKAYGSWRTCAPGTARKFSAVAYFFGREIHGELGVPIGLIDASWGGTRIESWTPAAGFAAVPELQHILDEVREADSRYEKEMAAYLDRVAAWVPAARSALARGETVAPPRPPKHRLNSYKRPTGLYNGLIHPFTRFGIRGVIWYQGEANHSDGMIYREKMKALIFGWRRAWGQGDFPFYFVQPTPLRYKVPPFRLPELWQAQAETLSLPNTGMVVTNDIGELDNGHPGNKQDVGKRLALWAMARTYGREGLVYSGPLYRSMSVEGANIRVSFDHVGTGLASRDGGPLTWFEIAAADRKFVIARAKIEGETVVVSSDAVPKPAGVRFAWNEVTQPNLMNKEGLPASAFRAFVEEGITAERAIEIAREVCKGKIALPENLAPTVEKRPDHFVVTFPKTLDTGIRSPAFHAQVLIDRKTGDVTQVLRSP